MARFPGQEARLCRAECPPHFLFVLPKRKRAGHGTKEKALRDELPGKAVNSPKTGAGRHELPTELETPLPAALYLNLNQCAAASAGMEHNGVQIGHPLLLFPLPLPRLAPGGVSKGEGRSPPLCATRGYGGRVAAPMFRVGV